MMIVDFIKRFISTIIMSARTPREQEGNLFEIISVLPNPFDAFYTWFRRF